jgi:hypothetical protein
LPTQPNPAYDPATLHAGPPGKKGGGGKKKSAN